jgi:hypothetical protein
MLSSVGHSIYTQFEHIWGLRNPAKTGRHQTLGFFGYVIFISTKSQRDERFGCDEENDTYTHKEQINITCMGLLRQMVERLNRRSCLHRFATLHCGEAFGRDGGWAFHADALTS